MGHLTVGESYFFRHELHFHLLGSRLEESSELVGSRGFRILSLGSSTGEEAYSAAITARESLGPVAASKVEILGCDVTRASVERATRGSYSYWSFRGAPQGLRERYFEPADDGTWRLIDELREQVRFDVMAIQNRLATLAPGSVDVVFFRNVAIYLTEEAVAEIYPEILRVLRADGLLFVAPANPRPAAGFGRIEHECASVYRKGEAEIRSNDTPAVGVGATRRRLKATDLEQLSCSQGRSAFSG